MIKLILKLKETQIDEFNLEKSMINIGRSQENEIAIDNIAISRRHAQMELREGKGYVLRDLGSSNGTFLNGVQIDANDHELNDGDVVGIAKFEILVKGLTLAPKALPKVPGQGDIDGTIIYEAPRRKPTPEPAAIPEQKVVHWPPLKAMKGPAKGKEFKITKEITTIGKGSQNDIPVEGWFVSSPQARIRRQGERFYLSHHGGFFSSYKNVVTRALGLQPTVDVEVQELATQPGDSLILCSDGLSDLVLDEEMLTVSHEASGDLNRACKELTRLANQRGGKDNITVLLIQIDPS